jgi:hypothetical protein
MRMFVLMLGIAFLLFQYNGIAQLRGEYYLSQKETFDCNLLVGSDFTLLNWKYTPSYNTPINSYFATPSASVGIDYGFDINYGFFYNESHTYGFGVGLMVMNHSSQITIDSFHTEYKAYDKGGGVYRQLVTSNGAINESITSSVISIPLVFKIKRILSDNSGWFADLGLLVSNKNKVNYSTDASFDYEAVNTYMRNSTGFYVRVYDERNNPSDSSWLITKANYEKVTDGKPISQVFDSLRAHGYNVALGQKPLTNSGVVNYPGISLGFIVKPGFTLNIKKRYFFNVGGYLTYQFFNNNAMTQYRLTDNLGTVYNSVYNNISVVNQISYGVFIGAKVFLGHSDIYNELEQSQF